MSAQSISDQPYRIFRRGTLKDLPQWDFRAELQKAICYQKAGGWSEQTSKNHFYSENKEELIQATLDVISGRMTIEQIAEAAGFKESTIYKRVQVLVGRELVDKQKVKINNRSTNIYWRI